MIRALARILGGGLLAAIFALVIVAGAAGMWSRADDVFLPGGNVAFLDPDCYSRMTRVSMILAGEGPSIRFHAFENAPQGVVPHTSWPVDGLIVLLAKGLGVAGVAGPADIAGAVVSPLLGIAFLFGLAVWARGRKYGLAALMLAAFSPIMAHGFSVGRPDHQAMVILFVTGALVAELAIWRGSRTAGWWSAPAWALACWVSLFEPLILLLLCLALRFLVLKRGALPDKKTVWAGVIFVGGLAGAMWFDGWRNPLPSAATTEFFGRWAAEIGELQGVGLSGIAAWAGWLCLVMPLVLVVAGIRKKDKVLLASGILPAVLFALTLGAARWGYFYVVVCALALPLCLELFRPRAVVWAVFVVSLWPVAAAWERQIYPTPAEASAVAEQRAESLLLMQVASRLGPGGTVLAPWWLSPALAYWSGAPAVAGSSHQSLPGTVDAARIFLSTDDSAARQLLQERQVAYVVVDDPARVVDNARKLIRGENEPMKESLAARLYRGEAPEGLALVFSNRFFRLYQVVAKDLERSSTPR